MAAGNSQPIFALDIGTRSVVGLLLHNLQDSYEVIEYIAHEHKERSMVDGQIHDVIAVAEIIKNVKHELEKKHGPLQKVAVAAAGRSLKTKRAKIAKDIEGKPLLTKDDILTMELEAVQLAQTELADEIKEADQTQFYCVGYSVIRFTLDDETIGNLIDQRGRVAAVEIIATFLPRVVVDSLISALKRADLEMEALTLEPIAAINVLIPASMRRLNVALIDIGAGTSDIAITSEGSITAYGMVPFAGDEITDALSQQYILDFKVAEGIKRLLYCKEEVEFDDILGFHQKLTTSQVVKEIQLAIQQLAANISQEIITLNGKAPQAVMLIGGGALTPTLNKWVAELLGLPENRVGIRGLQLNQQIIFDENLQLTGPEAVTPIGIAIAAQQHPVKYLSVMVNENTVRLFDLRKLTVGDAVLTSGMNIKKLYGKPGLALSVEINGKIVYIPGTLGHPPLIQLNGKEASIDQRIQEDDYIQIKQGQAGLDAHAKIKDIIEQINTLDVYVNNQLYSVPPSIQVNGHNASLEYDLQDRDQVVVSYPSRVQDILEYTGIDIESLKPKKMHYSLNQEEKSVEQPGAYIMVNGKVGSLSTPVQHGDQINVQQQVKKNLTIEDVLSEDLAKQDEIVVTFNDELVRLANSLYTILRNDQLVDFHEPINAGDQIQLVEKEQTGFCYQDVFRYVDIDTLNHKKGKKFVLLINDQPVRFDTPIQHGDQLELKWE